MTTVENPQLRAVSTAALVGNARRVPFYRDHLPGMDTPSFDALPSFDKHASAAYGRFPLSADGPVGAHRVLATSGTTGNRMFVALDRDDWDRTAVWMATVAARAGLGPEDVLLNTHCYGLWVGGPALDLLASRAGACLVPLGPVSPARVLELLRDGYGTAISATPSYLRRLVEQAASTGFDLTATGLRLGFIGAEPAEPALRQKLLALLPAGFRWVELYGLTETAGPAVAFSPEPTVLGGPLPDLEVNTTDFLVEVLETHSDLPVPSGAVGELTLTTRRTDCRTPLIRYRTRDLVRGTPDRREDVTRLSPILGRVDDSLKIGGVLMYPSAVAEVVTAVLPATAEWRAVVRRQGEDDELLLEVEGSTDLCRALVRAFDERIGMHVTAIPVTADNAPERSREKTRRLVGASDGSQR